MFCYLDPGLEVKTPIFDKPSNGTIIFPYIGADSGKTSCPGLLDGPLHEPLPYPLPPVWWANRDAVDQEALPILRLVDGVENLHLILREDILLLIAQPRGRIGVDHPHHTLVVGNKTV